MSVKLFSFKSKQYFIRGCISLHESKRKICLLQVAMRSAQIQSIESESKVSTVVGILGDCSV